MEQDNPVQTNHFAAALTSWFESNKQVSLRQIAISTDVSNLSLFRSGARPITFDAIAKLLPAIEANSNRTAAITILIAYLHDETPPAYQRAVRIDAIDPAGATAMDDYQRLSKDWEQRSRRESSFFSMWLGLDNFMHHPEILEATPIPQPTEIHAAGQKLTLYSLPVPGQTSRVAEDPPTSPVTRTTIKLCKTKPTPINHDP